MGNQSSLLYSLIDVQFSSHNIVHQRPLSSQTRQASLLINFNQRSSNRLDLSLGYIQFFNHLFGLNSIII